MSSPSCWKTSNFRNIKSQKPHFYLIITALSCPKRNIHILENAPWIFSERFASSMWWALTTERPHRCTCTSQLCSSCIAMTISSEPPHWSGTKRIPVVKQVDFSGRTYRLMHICIRNSRRENSKTTYEILINHCATQVIFGISKLSSFYSGFILFKECNKVLVAPRSGVFLPCQPQKQTLTLFIFQMKSFFTTN